MRYSGKWWLLVIPQLLFTLTGQAQDQCGVERWSVKTGTDSDAASIDLNSAAPTTIGDLITRSAPANIPPTSRVSPTETTVWTVPATLVEFKQESDSDYHLVLRDDAGDTMIAEIPSPGCVGSNSPFAQAIAQARSQFDARFTVTPSFQQANVPVQVTGVGMFDFPHGQTGAAPNQIELHPILKIDFGTLSLSVSPSAVSLEPGGSTSVNVTASAATASSAPVSLAISGTPPDVTAVFAPTSISVPGTSTLTLAAAPNAQANNSTLTISGSADGSTSSSTVALSIVSGADFSLSASPAALAVIPGTPATTTIASTPTASFASDIALSTSGLPAGLTASFNPVTIASPGNGSSVMTIAADPTAAAGSTNLQIGASGGGTTHTVGVALNICTAPPPPAALSGLRSTLHTDAPASFRDDDDSRIRVVPTQEALTEARQHGGDPICTPQQSDIFIGSGWTEPANRARQLTLLHVSAALRAGALCGAAKAPSAPVVHEAFDHVEGNLSDLQIQIHLQRLLSKHQLEVPTSKSLYVVFLAPEIHSQIGDRRAGRSYLAYHNHFHGREGVVHYVVVPFDLDPKRQKRTAARAILNALIDPDGPVG